MFLAEGEMVETHQEKLDWNQGTKQKEAAPKPPRLRSVLNKRTSAAQEKTGGWGARASSPRSAPETPASARETKATGPPQGLRRPPP